MDPCLIHRLHDVTDDAKLAQLVDAMRRDGWMGRPLLIAADGDGWQAWTGSHRLAAALAAGLEDVPVEIVPEEVVAALNDAGPINGWDAMYSQPQSAEDLRAALADGEYGMPADLLALYAQD